MAAYLIAERLEITDPDAMEAYRAGVGSTIEQYGGKFVVRRSEPETIEGDWDPKRLIVIEFPERAALKAWYDSPEYTELKAMRMSSSRWNIIAVDGL